MYDKPLGVEYRTHRFDCSEGVYKGVRFEVETVRLTGAAEEAAKWLAVRRGLHQHLCLETGWSCNLHVRVHKVGRKPQYLIRMWWEPATDEDRANPPKSIEDVFLEWVKELDPRA